MPSDDVHVEPFLHLVDVDSDAALVAWGAFHFVRDHDSDRWRDRRRLRPAGGTAGTPASATTPSRSGTRVVEVLDAAGTTVAEETDERPHLAVAATGSTRTPSTATA